MKCAFAQKGRYVFMEYGDWKFPSLCDEFMKTLLIKLIKISPHVKTVNASRAHIHRYQNVKRKLYNCNANIFFKQKCLRNNIIPIFVKINIPNTSPASKFTQHKASIWRLQDEIKYLYIKKQRLNQQLLKLHLFLVNSWKNSWPCIQNTIEEKNKVVPRLVVYKCY
jgi:hypothetical protein